MLLLPRLHGEGWGLWTPPLSPGFGPLRKWGAGSRRAGPPHPLVCVYMPGSLQFTAPSPACRRLHVPPRDCLIPRGSQCGPHCSKVGTGRLKQPGGGGVTGGLFLLVASPRAILRVGLGACCSFDTNSCHGWVWDGVALREHTSSWSMLVLGGGVRMEYGGPPAPFCPNTGVSLCQILPGLPSLASSSQGAAVMLALVHSDCPCVAPGLSLVLPLSFRGCGAVLDPPTPGSLAVRVWLGGGREGSVGAVASLVEPPHLILFVLVFFFW